MALQAETSSLRRVDPDAEINARIKSAVRVFTQDGVQMTEGMTCWDALGDRYTITLIECVKHDDTFNVVVRDSRARVCWWNLYADKGKARQACIESLGAESWKEDHALTP